jgi:hypothetical protein
VAIILAIAGIISVFIGHPVWAFFVELAAVVAGAIGFFMAASPRVSGGLMSIVAIIVALLGLGWQFSQCWELSSFKPSVLVPFHAKRSRLKLYPSRDKFYFNGCRLILRQNLSGACN